MWYPKYCLDKSKTFSNIKWSLVWTLAPKSEKNSLWNLIQLSDMSFRHPKVFSYLLWRDNVVKEQPEVFSLAIGQISLIFEVAMVYFYSLILTMNILNMGNSFHLLHYYFLVKAKYFKKLQKYEKVLHIVLKIIFSCC